MATYPANNLQDDTYRVGDDWQLVWYDEFEGEHINQAHWNLQQVAAGTFNEEWQRYTTGGKNAYIENGVLVIKANHETDRHGHDQYTSARLNTAHKQTFKYGKIVTRAQLPHSKGIWPAFWMLGADIDENGGNTPWPFCGEVDIFELYGTKNDAVVEANIHYAGLDGKHAMMSPPHYKLPQGKFADAFHVFEIEWDEQTITWRVDGHAYASTSIDSATHNAFHDEFFLLFNIAVGGTYAGYPDDSSIFPQFMYIDWVRVYQKEG